MATNEKDRAELLELYKDLRVADVRDGMDWVGMHHYGSACPGIRPLWRTRAVGLAKTVRYLPYGGPAPKETRDEYTRWSDWYYNHVCTYPWMAEVREGDFVCVDMSGLNVGLLGSHNTLVGFKAGCRGYITNGGVRDTDEIILQKIPFWSAMASQPMVQARLQFDGKDVPIALGGVRVVPGDVIVADGDGVVVVPQAIARDVAVFAHQELRGDKAARGKLYKELGLPPDGTV